MNAPIPDGLGWAWWSDDLAGQFEIEVSLKLECLGLRSTATTIFWV